MPAKTLDHCQELVIPLDTAHSGSIQVTVGGLPGWGAVDLDVSPGNENLSVDTGDQKAVGVSQATQLTFHYRAKEGQPQSVQIVYVLL